MDEWPDILNKRFPFFEKELLKEIQEKGFLQEVERDEEILQEGQLIRSFPIVLKGAVRVVRNDADGRELLLYYLNAGEVCSMSLICCVGQQQSNVRAIAEQKSLIVRIPVEYIDRWMVQFQSWKSYLMNSYRKRFDELLETIDSIAFSNMDERLEKFFRNRFQATGEKVFKGKHQDIAWQLNTSREVVSRLLKKMEQKGLVRIYRGRIDFSMLTDR
ncbi:MAG: hypothetical protein A2W90_15415 [Bacteroidetes bacterium GWF2_42_66]|nr:MAG: hypothetical protein A2W89_19330 [Bacteroidetes bacterium GWE2_42_39]OFY41026.1 MAG: hypothetical protein A2W90_15415 [Bacteroidetes bacterium GWF2_42_66]HBL76620.1 Crp/Fnr family transcriptional regulator [Prolixibacteraceae bacterium]